MAISAAERHRQVRQFPRYVALGTTAAMLSVVLLSAVGLAAPIGPARRGLAVQPTEALREE